MTYDLLTAVFSYILIKFALAVEKKASCLIEKCFQICYVAIRSNGIFFT